MKIRTQLLVAFLLLAVLPMAAIVLVGYVSSQRAVREAVEQEASVLTAEMEGRLRRVRGEMRERVERVGAFPFARLAEVEALAESREKDELINALVGELGESAALVERLEFIPRQPPPPRVRPELEFAAPAPPVEIAPRTFVIEMHETMRQVEEGLREIEDEATREEARRAAEEGLAAAAVAMKMFVRDAEASSEELEAAREAMKIRLRERDEVASREQEQREVEAVEQEIEAVSVESDREWGSFRVDFGDGLAIPVLEEGEVVGQLKADVDEEDVLRRVLERTRRTQGEVPFALAADGELFTLDDEDRATLSTLPIVDSAGADVLAGNWVVVTSDAPSAGMRFGIARPIRESLEELRQTALRNFAFGTGLIGLALLGVIPISRRISRNVQEVTAAAEKIAEGDLSIRVPVRSRNEIGQLAAAFNSMTSDLSANQMRLLEEERSRRDGEIERQLLRADVDRKTQELEDARRFQLSLLPKSLPQHESFELAVKMSTATEVGGDYYDFVLAAGGTLTTAVGDATGHGARAGTMVTVIKSLFSAYPPGESLASFLSEAGGAIRRMELGRMAMALTLARLEGGRLRIAAAGMPPALLFERSSGRVREIESAGMPLGSFATEYHETTIEVAAGDTLLLMTDGLPELPNADGEPLGYERAAEAFARCAAGSPSEIVESLGRVVASWTDISAPADDVTFVVLRVA